MSQSKSFADKVKELRRARAAVDRAAAREFPLGAFVHRATRQHWVVCEHGRGRVKIRAVRTEFVMWASPEDLTHAKTLPA